MTTSPTSSFDFKDLSKPLPTDAKGSLKGYSVSDLTARLNAMPRVDVVADESLYLRRCAPEYQDTFACWKRPIGIAAAIPVSVLVLTILGSLVYGIIQASTGLQLDLHVFTSINSVTIGTAVGIVVLFTGAFIVIHRARTKREELLGDQRWEVDYIKDGVVKSEVFTQMGQIPQKNSTADKGPVIDILHVKKLPQENKAPTRGSFFNMGSHLHTVYFTYKTSNGSKFNSGYLDTSTLDANGNGKCFIYNTKECGEHYFISTVVSILGTPFYLIGTIVYNVLRAAVIPFYILFQITKELISGKNPENERKFHILDIPTQVALSIGRVIKAPFYALAYFLAALYSLVNPMGGRKLGSSIERDWNGGVTLNEGFWSVQGEQEHFDWEKRKNPDQLGGSSFYLAGCWQPIGIVEMENFEIKTAYWISKMVDPTSGAFYDVRKRSDLETLVKSPFLKDEYIAIKKELVNRQKRQ